MRDLLNLIRWMLLGLVRSRRSLEAENLALRHQLKVLHRRAPKRPALRDFDRLLFVCLYRIAPRILDTFTIVKPKTVLREDRVGGLSGHFVKKPGLMLIEPAAEARSEYVSSSRTNQEPLSCYRAEAFRGHD